MSISDTADRYVTFGIYVPDGQTVDIPVVAPSSLPVWFPNVDDFFPKGAQVSYAIRNTTGATSVLDPDGGTVSIPTPGWWVQLDDRFQYVPDTNFFGGIPDVSGGTRYPSAGIQSIPVDPPQWVIDGTPPPQDPSSDPGSAWEPQPDPGGSGLTPVTSTTTPEGTT